MTIISQKASTKQIKSLHPGLNLDLALSLATRGFLVFPCKEKTVSTKNKIKDPYTPHGYLSASKNPEQIRRWWTAHPGALVGIPCIPNGFWTLDLDRKPGRPDGVVNFQVLAKGKEKPKIGPMQSTLSGGLHMLFKLNGKKVKQSAGQIAPGVDVRSKGYICTGASQDEGEYKWQKGHGFDTPLTTAPDWLMDLVTGQTETVWKVDPETNQVASQTPAKVSKFRLKKEYLDGKRSNGLIAYMGWLKTRGYSDTEAQEKVLKVNEERCKPPLSLEELKHTVFKSGEKYAQGPVGLLPDAPNMTDVANAHRFEELYKGQVLYCKDLKSWFFWDGKRWQADRKDEITVMAMKGVADSILQEVANAKNRSDRELLLRGWIRTSSALGIDAFLRLSRGLLAVGSEELDQAPGFLNLANGILNMETGELSPHDPARFITKLMDVDYDPKAKSPKWDAFMTERVPKKENREYLQRIIGYALSGRGDGKKVPFLYGYRDTGKSTFLRIIEEVVGEYSRRIPIDVVLANRNSSSEGPTPFMRSIFGARMVIASEIPENRTLNDGTFKDLSGGDAIAARGLHEAAANAKPTHCLVLYGNNKPHFKDKTGALTNRVAIVGFNVPIPLDKQRNLSFVIPEFLEERSGILNWLIQGYQKYILDGLKEPKDIEEARREYESEQDIIQRFLEESCQMGEDLSVPKTSLHEQYMKWCKGYHERPETRRKFIQTLIRKGFEEYGMGGSKLKGLEIKIAWEGDEESTIDLTQRLAKAKKALQTAKKSKKG